MIEEPYVYEIRQVNSPPLYNVQIDIEAPKVPGFIAIKADAYKNGFKDSKENVLPAVKYINLAYVTEITVTKAMLRNHGINGIIPDIPQKVKTVDYL